MGSLITTRHNMVLHNIVKLCRQIQFHCNLEPTFRDIRNARNRPDATLISGTPLIQSTMIDVSIIHPGSNSYVNNIGQNKLGCASKREKDKINKYQEIAYSEHMKFIPLVMESSGAFGKYFIDFINQLSTQVADQRIMSSKQFRHYAHSTIAFTLQRGNSIIY